MSHRRLFLLSALAACIATAGLLFVRDWQRSREARRLRDANERLRFETGLRHHAAATPAIAAPLRDAPPIGSDQSAATAVARNSSTPEPRPTAPAVLDDYRNEGTATPLAALHTLAWLGDRGDAEAVGRMLVFDDSARARAQAFFDGLPPEVRSAAGTLDQFAAIELTANIIHLPFPRAGMLDRAQVETNDGDRAVLVLPGSTRERMEFQRTADGWKYVITTPMVDSFLARRRTPKG